MDKEERQSIIDEAVEKALLALPDAWSNLITEHSELAKINQKFYNNYPEFKNHKDAVVSVLGKIDGENPFLSHIDKLEKSIPEIRERIGTMAGLDTETVNPNPDRAFEPIKPPDINGVL